eukprot:145883_1
MAPNEVNLRFRRVSSADTAQEKSFTKIPKHLTNEPLYHQIHWPNCLVVFGIPLLAVYGIFTTEFHSMTVLFAVIYYFFTGMGVTAGYHRLWSHASYKASSALQILLMIASSGALQGSAKYWAYLHRAHHRWTDTDRDPYNSMRGFWYAHFGWLLFRCDRVYNICIKDLKSNRIIAWQHNHYVWFGPFMTLVFPALVTWYLWDDFRGGFYIAGALRCALLHQGTWCVNSLAHSDLFGGKQHFDDTITPHDSVITAILTFGEGYHNFHHEFPSDYRNGIRWYQYDPTKWFLRLCRFIGAVYELNQFDANEIKRGMLDMREKNLVKEKESVNYGVDIGTLPVWTMDEYVQQRKANESKHYVIFNDIVHQIPIEFINKHPGGVDMIRTRIGKDITKLFNGDIYNHSNAARNVLSHYRIACMNTYTK